MIAMGHPALFISESSPLCRETMSQDCDASTHRSKAARCPDIARKKDNEVAGRSTPAKTGPHSQQGGNGKRCCDT